LLVNTFLIIALLTIGVALQFFDFFERVDSNRLITLFAASTALPFATTLRVVVPSPSSCVE
jgi:hypothetical protein